MTMVFTQAEILNSLDLTTNIFCSVGPPGPGFLCPPGPEAAYKNNHFEIDCFPSGKGTFYKFHLPYYLTCIGLNSKMTG